MLVTHKRPRVLDWFHAGPLLFGDWGTSRLYVLGIAFTLTGFASPIYLVGLSLLMVGVAWAYTIICSHFHDGGGVYTASRQISPLLSVVGATLLMADYIVTASLSLVDAFHYFGLPEDTNRWLIIGCVSATLALLGLVNWFGAKNAGRFALYIAILAMAASAIIAISVIPFLRAGFDAIRWTPAAPAPTPTTIQRWTHFAGIILALSGVEAVANMTGIMKEPVARTSKRTIWPILGEVATLNIIFSVALLGIVVLVNSHAAEAKYSAHDIEATAMKVLATEGGQHWFGPLAGLWLGKMGAIMFGLLLVSAANTVIVDMVGVLYSLGRDRELPGSLTKLNYSGVPRWPLLIACVAPALVILVFGTAIDALSNLYAIGVCGAISMNVICCAINKRLPLTRFQRGGMWVIGGVVSAIWVTIALTKHDATIFAGGLVALALAFRFISQRMVSTRAAMPEPEMGWLSALRQVQPAFDPSRPRIMLAARGRNQAEFAVDLARRKKSTLFVIYVRNLRVMEMGTSGVPNIEADPDAQESLGTVAVLAHQYGVPMVPIYVCSPNIAEEILDYTVTYGCDTLILGKSKRKPFARRIEGDVVAEVAQHLPSEVALITRDSSPHPMPPLPPQLATNGVRTTNGVAQSNGATGNDPSEIGRPTI